MQSIDLVIQKYRWISTVCQMTMQHYGDKGEQIIPKLDHVGWHKFKYMTVRSYIICHFVALGKLLTLMYKVLSKNEKETC